MKTAMEVEQMQLKAEKLRLEVYLMILEVFSHVFILLGFLLSNLSFHFKHLKNSKYLNPEFLDNSMRVERNPSKCARRPHLLDLVFDMLLVKS